jgi:hypothetical protein
VATQNMITRFAQWQGRDPRVRGCRCDVRQRRVPSWAQLSIFAVLSSRTVSSRCKALRSAKLEP